MDRRSSLADVAIAVGDALRRAGIRAVLTGGACASLYSGGVYASLDADFILSESITVAQVDRALAPTGFRRRGDRYVHAAVPFFVEFPAGPLAIGADLGIRPVWQAKGRARTLALSPTDACRDRLAAFYHWNDRQGLAAAAAIAVRHRVTVRTIREWSRREGHEAGYAIFRTEVSRLRAARKAGNGKKRP